MKVLTAAEMREVDRLTIERLGIPSLQLMETAGTRVAETLLQTAGNAGWHPRNVAVLCGKGNNGGDGFVVARHLKNADTRVRVYLFASPDDLRGDAAANFEKWKHLGGDVVLVLDEAAWKSAWTDLSAADSIVDAIFGTGFRGPLPSLIEHAIEDINRFSRKATMARPALILAVDTPSGLPSDEGQQVGTVLRAHATVTFTAPKIGQLVSPEASAAGALKVVAIGSPDSLVNEVAHGSLRWSEPEEFAMLPLVRATEANKGTYGHALIVAGSFGKSGAAILSSRAALRSGAGLVTVATPESALPMIASAQAEYMSEPLLATSEGTAALKNVSEGRFAKIEAGKKVLAVGPGLGLNAETQNFIRTIVQHTKLPVVLDADGLNAFAENADALRDRKTEFLVITPHPGEMARLLKTSIAEVQRDRVKTATDAARRWNVHVVLKGSHTVVASSAGQIFVNTSGNAGLAKGGSGDVLTGVLAALTAQFGTEDWIRVLALGVFLHGKAAEVAVEGIDLSGLLAGEVADAIPEARRRLLLELRRGG
jgi:ADP-dependent NAD(P)H-hydrate dehydratase / NAD(P)H-hydrate epimerase